MREAPEAEERVNECGRGRRDVIGERRGAASGLAGPVVDLEGRAVVAAEEPPTVHEEGLAQNSEPNKGKVWVMYKAIRNSNLSAHKLQEIVTEFAFNTPARVAAEKLGLHRNTINFWYQRMREGLAKERDPGPFSGEVEIDESYFGKKKTGKGRRGTVQGQVAVFGLRERRSGLVIAEVVPGVSAKELLPLIEKHIVKGSTIYSDGHGAYYHLAKLGYRHRVVYHDHTFVDQRVIHTNSIESFWAYAKHILRGRKGLPYEAYPDHIKEVQKRYNTFETKKLRLSLRRILQNNH